jgi:hypothetical protein
VAATVGGAADCIGGIGKKGKSCTGVAAAEPDNAMVPIAKAPKAAARRKEVEMRKVEMREIETNLLKFSIGRPL